MVCLTRPYPFKFFKRYLPQILLGPFLNSLSHIHFLAFHAKPFYLHELLHASVSKEQLQKEKWLQM